MNTFKNPASPRVLFFCGFILSFVATLMEIKGGRNFPLGVQITFVDITTQLFIGLIMGGIGYVSIRFLSTVKPDRLVHFTAGFTSIVLGAQLAQILFVSFFYVIQLIVFAAIIGYGYQRTVTRMRKQQSLLK